MDKDQDKILRLMLIPVETHHSLVQTVRLVSIKTITHPELNLTLVSNSKDRLHQPKCKLHYQAI
jgi:hypothetical protein